MCLGCLRERGGAGPYPAMSDEEHRAVLELLPTWVLAQKVAALLTRKRTEVQLLPRPPHPR
jgi:predicted Fe-S protein YdhL (DUF1289 family)